MKLENTHICQSFKYRGIGNFCRQAKEDYERKNGSSQDLHFVIASSGNAGLAAACAAQALGVKCTVILPEGASSKIVDVFAVQNAKVRLAGRFYAEAALAAREYVKTESGGCVITGS